MERRAHPTDRRSTLVVLTPGGERVAEQVARVLETLERTVRERIRGGDADALGRVVTAILEATR